MALIKKSVPIVKMKTLITLLTLVCTVFPQDAEVQESMIYFQRKSTIDTTRLIMIYPATKLSVNYMMWEYIYAIDTLWTNSIFLRKPPNYYDSNWEKINPELIKKSIIYGLAQN